MLRIVRILSLGLLLICPACRRGRMFRSLFVMNVRCPVCGVIFERAPRDDYAQRYHAMVAEHTALP